MDVKRAFTLIELLVVIAIIGILSAVVLASLNSTRVKARNTERISDVRELGKAFILAYDAANAYPATSGTWACVSTVCTGGMSTFVAQSAVDAAITPYISKPTYPAVTATPDKGYAFNDNFTSAAPSGVSIPRGAYIQYEMETPGSCGPGLLYASSTNYLLCMYQLP